MFILPTCACVQVAERLCSSCRHALVLMLCTCACVLVADVCLCACCGRALVFMLCTCVCVHVADLRLCSCCVRVHTSEYDLIESCENLIPKNKHKSYLYCSNKHVKIIELHEMNLYLLSCSNKHLDASAGHGCDCDSIEIFKML